LDGHYVDLPPDLRSNILGFYQDLGAPIATKTNERDWAKLQEELDRLEAVDRDLGAGSPKSFAVVSAPVSK
jgi:hypothetical protein